MSIFLDIDRARSVFKLLFLCSLDGVGSDNLFDESLAQITLGVKIPKQALKKLRLIYSEIAGETLSVASLARQVSQDFSGEPDILCSVLRLVIRLANDDGMLCGTDRQRVREVLLEFNLGEAELWECSEAERCILESCAREGHLDTKIESLRIHFEILGCTPEMSAQEIKRRYRLLAMRYHPDRSASRSDQSDTREHFERIQHAYQSLRDHFVS